MGIAISEYAWCDPSIYGTLMPALMRTKGFLMLNSTVLGHNHLFEMYNNVIDHKDWYVEYSPVQLCFDQNGKPLFDPIELRSELEAGVMSYAKFRQEFLCDWNAAIEGAIFTRELEHATMQGRIGEVPIVPGVPVSVFLDIGVNAKTGVTALWFVQFLSNGNIRFVDYFEDADQPAEYYVNVIFDWRDKHGVSLHKSYLPHDAASREKISCSTYAARYRELGMPVEVIPRIARKDLAIEASRKFFRNYHIDSKKCKRGVQALREYRKDIINKTHWANHSVDAFLAVGQFCEINNQQKPIHPANHSVITPSRNTAW